ncbi:MAG: hypothetical protein AAGA60_29440 [Cyanobacteria bacterium P01_E01_bin.42]
MGRLDRYLQVHVPAIVGHYKKQLQNPYTAIEPTNKTSLILLPKHADIEDADPLKREALKAEVKQDYQTAKNFWTRVLVVSPANPEAIDAIERLAAFRSQPTTPSQGKSMDDR